MSNTLTMTATPSIQRDGDGWHIRVVVQQPGLPTEILDARVWPLIEPAARILAGYLAEEKVRLWRHTMESCLQDCLRPGRDVDFPCL
ncbi:MAG: hypothetical protein P4L36_16855 [Holophaga sp.]|nr:hypothetical protein [Holophaga sp.]